MTRSQPSNTTIDDRFWAQNLYEVEPHFGTEEDLHSLIAEVHARGMLLMLDVVVNHMGYAAGGLPWEIDWSVFRPFNDSKYFHDYCEILDPESAKDMRQCWLGSSHVPLADLRTEDPEVQDMFGMWIREMVANYSIDGLRIDTSINVDPEFFINFVDAAGVFATGEVMQGDASVACEWADTIGSILNYPIYYTLTRAFESSEGSINDLVRTIESVKEICPNSTSFGSFSENHDVARFASLTDDSALAKNIITYTVMADGIPIIYQGQEQRQYGSINPYYNRSPLWQAGFDTSAPLYKHIATLNRFRKHVINKNENYTDYMAEVVFQDLHSLALRKGFNGSQVITVLNNDGQNCGYFELDIGCGHDYAPGTVLTEILTCKNLTVDDSGNLTVPMFAGTPKVLYPVELLANSSICGMHPAPEPLPSATVMTVDATSSVHGRPTTYETVEVSPLPPFTTHLWSTINGLPTTVETVVPFSDVTYTTTRTTTLPGGDVTATPVPTTIDIPDLISAGIEAGDASRVHGAGGSGSFAAAATKRSAEGGHHVHSHARHAHGHS